mmetsp:Transcript_10011/g.22435  ORF Transcript_10011/g.22435 Transcript_10011/m.22435 type:complete len:884 (-) Transcript_10011:4-2655(-)
MAHMYTVGSLDEMCLGIDRLAQQLTSQKLSSHEESVRVAEVVQLVQRMGEGMAWAYNQHQHTGLGENFAQPFLDRHIRERLKELLTDTRSMRVEARNEVAAQILQTIHILLQATPSDSVLFCSLTAGWYLNDVVTAPLDFRDNEDLLPLWMTVVKDIASMLSRDNLMLFFDPGSKKPFPIFTEAVKYYHHPVAQVRTHVQATSLDIFLKLRDDDMWNEPLFQLVLAESSVYFTHVSCLLRDFWKMADDAVRSGARRDARNAIYIQNDILMYINDVFSCEIPQVTEILQEKLLRFAVLPVLVRSVVRPPEFTASEYLDKSLTEKKLQPKDSLASATAWYFLYDVLCTLRSPQVVSTVARVLLRTALPDEVPRAAMAPPPRTPSQYSDLQAQWGSASTSGAFDSAGPAHPDEDLYAMPPVPLVPLIDDKSRPAQRNTLPDVLVTVVLGLVADCSSRNRSQSNSGMEGPRAPSSVLAVVAMLLRSAKEAGEQLSQALVEKLGTALCNLLDLHRLLEWPLLESGLNTLQELFLASNSAPGRASELLGGTMIRHLLQGLAALLVKESKQALASGPAKEHLLQEFEEQWILHQQGLKQPSLASLQRELLESGTDVDPKGSYTHRELTFCRSQCLLLALHARRIQQSAGGLRGLPGELPDGSTTSLQGMPGYSDVELDEWKTYKPGVAVHIGKRPRIKCQVQVDRRLSEEPLYLLTLGTQLVLVKPDDLKPFFAVPVIVEPLRHVRLADQSAGRSPLEPIATESKRPLSLEIAKPASPFFHQSRNLSVSQRNAAPMTGSLGTKGEGFMARAAKLVGRSGTLELDSPLATVQAMPFQDEELKSVQLTLFFAEDRRLKMATGIICSGKDSVSEKMAEEIERFLIGILDEAER